MAQTQRERADVCLSCAVLRGLVGYLFLAWALIRFASPSGEVPVLVSVAVLAGFPLVIAITRVLHRHGARWLRGGWAVAATSMLATISVPLICLALHRPPEPTLVVEPDSARFMPASLVATHLRRASSERLRLRIKGLTLLAGYGEDVAAELWLNTSMREREGSDEILIEVELRTGEAGEVFWRDEYTATPDDIAAIHDALVRALGDAMRQTEEGYGGGQLV